MRRVSQIVAFFAVLLAIGTLFQNCGQYAPSDTLTDQLNSTSTNCATSPTATGCPADLNGIQLVIANQNPITVTITGGGTNGYCDTSNCVDVSGYCYVGSYPQNQISVEIQQGNGVVSLPQTVLGSCDSSGRFRVLVPVPALAGGSIYTLTMTLQVFDSQGVGYTNPSGLGSQQVNLTSQ